MILVVGMAPILKVGSRLVMIWLRNPLLRVHDLRLEGWGHLELNIKDDVGGC